MKMKTPPVLQTTFKIITNRQNVRETLYEIVSQVSSEKKKKKKNEISDDLLYSSPFLLGASVENNE